MKHAWVIVAAAVFVALQLSSKIVGIAADIVVCAGCYWVLKKNSEAKK